MAAGGSVGGHRAHQYAVEIQRSYRNAYEVCGRYTGAAEAERKAIASLLALETKGWRLLVHQAWPTTKSAAVLIGAGGVFVIDLKVAAEPPVVAGGHLRIGDERRDSDAERLLATTHTIDQHVASLGMSPVALRPLMVFTGHYLDVMFGRVRLLGDRNVVQELVAEPKRLTPAMVTAVTNHLVEVLPAYESPRLGNAPIPSAANEPASLFDVEELEQAALRSALNAPIEGWMTFLHPEQAAMVRRTWKGPARISGPAGTGKTVVGLHRAAYLAERTTGRVLYVTYARNLPRVQGQLFRRMSSTAGERVEFTSLHAWARTFLDQRGVPVNLNGEKARTAFFRAWSRVGKDSVLPQVEPLPSYWQEEIDYVIKGRGLTSLREYLLIARHGRRTALMPEHRRAAWRLYEEYESLRAERAIHDFNDVLLAALSELQSQAVEPAYSAVIVDEVQDLTLIGIKLLHALIGEAANGLLLIGDGQQSVYPGGFRLAEAGIVVKGRAAVLRTNYRNSSRILDAALQVVSADPFEDIEESSSDGRRDVEVTLLDGQVVRETAGDETEHDRRLIEAINALCGEGTNQLSAAAVLCATLKQIDHYHGLLTRAGIPVLRLEHYDGVPVDAVKLGTYHRAKGLEFKYVFLPQHSSSTATGSAADLERSFLLRRQLYVAMTRARDLLWLGAVDSAMSHGESPS